jgi:radical SAM-linked protein
MAYSQGFNPHPKVSWVSAAPTGVASEAEYVEIGLVERVDPAALAKALDESLPPGLDILDIVEAVSGGSSLSERIDATEFSLELPGITPEELTAAVERLLSATSVEVERLTKNGRRPLDVRPAIVSAQVEVGTDTSEAATQQDVRSDTSAKSVSCGILRAVVRQTTPTVRPDDVLSALAVVADLHPPVPAKATRLGQGRLDDRNRLIDPLAQDRG